MAHNARAKATWANGDVPTATQFNTLDQNQFESINGDQGGSWAPATALVIGGAGVDIAMDPVGDVFPKLPSGHAGRSRTIAFRWNAQVHRGAAQWLLEGGTRWIASQATSDVAAIDIPVHNGATLSTIVVRYDIATSHFPATKLGFQVYRQAVSTGELDSLISSSPSPVTGSDAATYYGGGATQTHTITCDQNNVLNTSLYSYFLVIVEESGSGALAGNKIRGLSASFTSIVDMRFA